MKKILPFIIMMTVTMGKLFAQTATPNGGFENWVTSWSDPAYYSTSNGQTVTQQGGTPNVTEVAGWTSGVNGVQLTTEITSLGDTVPAFINNAINNPLQGIGGVPYNQKPTGLEIWYNCTEVGDSGGIIICFKKGGVIMDTFLFAITGTVTTYPSTTFNFSPALNFTPDTVIFAATSSIGILRGKNGVAGSTLTLSGITFTGSGVDSQTVSINGNFTTWNTVLKPQGWFASFLGVTRTGDANSGSYALDLTTLVNPSNKNNVQWAGATTGMFNNNNGLTGGLPYTKTYDTLEFWYKYTQATPDVDSGWAEDDFIRNGSLVLDLFVQLPPTATYLHYGIIDSVSGGNPDSVIVSFYSSSYDQPAQNSVGSSLEVDDVHFTSQPSGIKPVLLADNSIIVYPNPASTQLTIGSAQSVINDVRLANILGQTVMDKQYSFGTATKHESIDVSVLPSGLYFITITTGDKVSTGKITISR